MSLSSSIERRNFWKGMAFLSPWLVGFCIFTLLPVLMSLYFSFCDFPIIQPPVYIGMENYAKLAHDEVFWQVVRNSLLYAGLALPLGLIVSLSVALLLNAKIPGQSIFRTIVFIPSLVPSAAAAMLWLWLLNQKLGLVNVLIEKLSLHHLNGPGWLTQPGWVIPSLVIISLWGMGNTIVIYLAGLQDVPRELYEAADLDGANAWQRLWNVTLPMISPVIFFNLVIAIIGVLQVFDLPFIMTQGGPARASYFFTNYLYDSAFGFHLMGRASAMAWIQLLIVLALTGVAFWTSRRWVHYQGK